MNVIHVIGRLGADSELRTAKSGRQYLSMRLATDEFTNGEKTTSWFNVTYTNERAVKMQEYLKKGRHISVIGSETVRTYQTKTGETAFSRDILADRIDFVNSGSSNQNQNGEESIGDTGKFEPTEKTDNVEMATATASVSDVDDLPF